MARQKQNQSKQNNEAIDDRQSNGLGGASDASSGGGAGSGIPGGGTDMRTDGAFSKGDVKQDRKKLFPEAKTKREQD